MKRLTLGCLLLMVGCLSAFPVQAQPIYQGTTTISAGVNRVFLGAGDHPGAGFYGAFTKHIGPRTGLVMQVGYILSIDRTFDPDDLDFRERHMVLGDLALHLDALQLESSGTEHRFGLQAGVSARHRDEEVLTYVAYPAAMEHYLAEDLLDEVRSRDDRFYLFEVDGQPYGVGTRVDEGVEAGVLMGLTYTLRFRRYMISAEVSYRSYQEGTPILMRGLMAGLRF